MIFTEMRLKGAFVIDPERLTDDRGFFARTYCEREFEARGLHTRWVQCSLSFNRKKGTLRGLHWQAAPHEEIRVVRCVQGAVYDVIVDLRDHSPTCREWVAVELTDENRRALYVPKGFAHGYQTLENDAEMLYMMSEFYHPECARVLRWDDPGIGIDWPEDPATLSPRDRGPSV
jgi:dTDP-4-dehydrorhamnose 3,5-epimerase